MKINMRIWELSKQSGLSIDTIRYYEKRWLIKSLESKENSNNYREYDIKCVQKIEYIKIMKKLWLTLTECKNGLEQMENKTLTCEWKKEFINNKISEIDKKIYELNKIKSVFEELLDFQDENNVDKVKKLLF